MRIRLGEMKNFIRESLMNDRYMDREAAEEFIGDMDGDETSDTNIIDEDTNEVYLKAGDEFNKSPWNPDHKVDQKKAQRDEEYARRAGVWDEHHADDEDMASKSLADLVAQRDETEESHWTKMQELEDEFHREVKEFESDFSNFTREMPDVAPEDAAYDMAANFFMDREDKWPTWARALGMSRQLMHDIVTDHVYDAMMKGASRPLR